MDGFKVTSMQPANGPQLDFGSMRGFGGNQEFTDAIDVP
jgi:hypothetical protein